MCTILITIIPNKTMYFTLSLICFLLILQFSSPFCYTLCLRYCHILFFLPPYLLLSFAYTSSYFKKYSLCYILELLAFLWHSLEWISHVPCSKLNIMKSRVEELSKSRIYNLTRHDFANLCADESLKFTRDLKWCARS